MRFALLTLPPRDQTPEGIQRMLDRACELGTYEGWAVTHQIDGGPAIVDEHRTIRWVSHRGPKRRIVTETLAVSTPLAPLYGVTDVLHTTESRVRALDYPGAWLPWVLAHLGARPGHDEIFNLYTQERIPAFDDMLPLEAA